MNTYLLLRDNKETGPHTLQELVTLGIKPYDLVWINGKSAAWRYPSEVQELKPYAPVVEEQPYDRFYQKKAVQPIEPEEAFQAYMPATKEEKVEVYQPKKSVFVTLPGQQKVVTEKPVPVKKVVPLPLPIEETETISITENIATPKIKYSQPLDDIKEMYVKTLQERKSKSARKTFWVKQLKVAAVVAGLVGIGIITGFIIRPKTNSSKVVVAAADQQEKLPPSLTENLVNQKDVDASLAAQEQVDATSPVTIEKNENTVPVAKEVRQKEKEVSEQRASQETEKPRALLPKQEAQPINAEKQFYLSAEKNPISGERTRTIRTDNAEPVKKEVNDEKPAVKSANTWGNLVTVSSNDYKKVAFGGIRNLELTVTNNSKYELDNVVVELQYLKPSEEPLKANNIVFKAIPANESATMRIPDTNRGIKILYKIISVGSKQQVNEGVANK